MTIYNINYIPRELPPQTAANTKSENEMRKSTLGFANRLGCGYETREIFLWADGLLAKTKEPLERLQISREALTRLHKLFSCKGALIVDGQIILPAGK